MKLVALFKKPPDIDSFEEHYKNIHIPLIMKLPGMKKLETVKVTGAPVTTPQYYRMAEMSFENQENLNASMMSLDGIAAAKDLMTFAKELVEIFYAEVER